MSPSKFQMIQFEPRSTFNDPISTLCFLPFKTPTHGLIPTHVEGFREYPIFRANLIFRN